MMEEVIQKEMVAWKSPAQMEQLLQRQTAPLEKPQWRQPVPGDIVTITGMRRRPELNGARAEVLGNDVDEHGRVAVRVFDSDGTRSHNMRIQPFRLQQRLPGTQAIASRSACPLPAGSALSAARPTSLLSGAGRSALSAARLNGSSSTPHLS